MQYSVDCTPATNYQPAAGDHFRNNNNMVQITTQAAGASCVQIILEAKSLFRPCLIVIEEYGRVRVYRRSLQVIPL